MSKQNSLKNYNFIKTIGEGTFGKVKLALHKITNEEVAIKILEKAKIKNKKDLERIDKENINKENDSIKQMYYQIETNNIKKEKNFEDFDDYLLDIKPPKLFIEPYNNKADNNQLFEIEPKCKKEINKLVKKENSFNINPKEHIKMNSNNSESLIILFLKFMNEKY